MRNHIKRKDVKGRSRRIALLMIKEDNVYLLIDFYAKSPLIYMKIGSWQASHKRETKASACPSGLS